MVAEFVNPTAEKGSAGPMRLIILASAGTASVAILPPHLSLTIFGTSPCVRLNLTCMLLLCLMLRVVVGRTTTSPPLRPEGYPPFPQLQASPSSVASKMRTIHLEWQSETRKLTSI